MDTFNYIIKNFHSNPNKWDYLLDRKVTLIEGKEIISPYTKHKVEIKQNQVVIKYTVHKNDCSGKDSNLDKGIIGSLIDEYSSISVFIHNNKARNSVTISLNLNFIDENDSKIREGDDIYIVTTIDGYDNRLVTFTVDIYDAKLNKVCVAFHTKFLISAKY